MKKALLFAIIAAVAVTSFAQDLSNRLIFIEGTADSREHLNYFLENFHAEALGTGYSVTENKEKAAFILNFAVFPNVIVDSEGVEHPPAPGDSQYVIRISLINNADDAEILFFDFFFTSLEEMYEHNRFLFLTAVEYIPRGAAPLDTRWQNKRVYLRASFDYPVIFHLLLPKGLAANGTAIWSGPPSGPGPTDPIAPQDHRIKPMPGFTVGLEFHFFKYFATEFNFQISFGDTIKNDFINIAVGTELKIPFRTNYFVFQPYGAFLINANSSSIYADFPSYAFGGGIQLNIKGFSSGAFFLDIKYLYSLGKVVMNNPYILMYENPAVIYYKRHVLGLGVGYKFGF